jgi:hypothetical protein
MGLYESRRSLWDTKTCPGRTGDVSLLQMFCMPCPCQKLVHSCTRGHWLVWCESFSHVTYFVRTHLSTTVSNLHSWSIPPLAHSCQVCRCFFWCCALFLIQRLINYHCTFLLLTLYSDANFSLSVLLTCFHVLSSTSCTTLHTPHLTRYAWPSIVIPCFIGLTTSAGGHDHQQRQDCFTQHLSGPIDNGMSSPLFSHDHWHHRSSWRCLDLPPLPNSNLISSVFYSYTQYPATSL